MKLLTPEELAALKNKKRRLGKNHPVRLAIERLEPGQALQVDRPDFTWKQHTPRALCTEISKKTNKRFVVSALLDNSGWVVERVDDGEE